MGVKTLYVHAILKKGSFPGQTESSSQLVYPYDLYDHSQTKLSPPQSFDVALWPVRSFPDQTESSILLVTPITCTVAYKL